GQEPPAPGPPSVPVPRDRRRGPAALTARVEAERLDRDDVIRERRVVRDAHDLDLGRLRRVLGRLDGLLVDGRRAGVAEHGDGQEVYAPHGPPPALWHRRRVMPSSTESKGEPKRRSTRA